MSEGQLVKWTRNGTIGTIDVPSMGSSAQVRFSDGVICVPWCELELLPPDTSERRAVDADNQR